MLHTLKRAWCFLWHGHDWVHAYARGYDGRELLVSRCRKCGHMRREVVREADETPVRARITRTGGYQPLPSSTGREAPPHQGTGGRK